MQNIQQQDTLSSVPSNEVVHFDHQFSNAAYHDIAPAREALLAFLLKNDVARSYADMLLLTLTEIITNLIKHPLQKAKNIQCHVSVQRHEVLMDISDDSSPFLDFQDKCNIALARTKGCLPCTHENGYGLACIMQQHASVQYISMTYSKDSKNHFIITDSHAPVCPATPQKHPAERKVVFMVDDDPVALKIHCKMLEKEYNVIAFRSAHDVLEAFQKILPDLIISDLTMPEMDGAGLRRAMMDMEYGNEIPFIFLSGFTDNQHKPQINQLGIDDFLCKPIEKDHLLAVVERLLKRSSQIRSAVQGKMDSEITELFKPALPDNWGNHWRFSVQNVMAEAGGGDFILQEETDTHMLAVLADVMGHGHMAKFFAFAYAGYLRSIFRMHDKPDPTVFFETLSSCTEKDSFLESMIVTCQSVKLAEDGTVDIVSAGHPPPILMTSTECHDVAVSGPLPGLSLQENPYKSTQVKLAEGHKLLLATDGFYDAFNNDKEQSFYRAFMMFCNYLPPTWPHICGWNSARALKKKTV
ncbi:MAG: fused response regulator/phosphatase [Alphaproteobacteria bacterium]|nr:fused response regulator/phosphatase [Alphaproteobacteria bacterium]